MTAFEKGLRAALAGFVAPLVVCLGIPTLICGGCSRLAIINLPASEEPQEPGGWAELSKAEEQPRTDADELARRKSEDAEMVQSLQDILRKLNPE